MKKYLLLLPVMALAGCNSTSTATLTSITSAVCTDAATLQQSAVKLNSNQTLALNGIISSCNATAGGTAFNNATVALAIINDAILLQGSGLLSNIHITAEAPPQQLILRKIKQHWARYAKYL